jgi:hypothetical protein
LTIPYITYPTKYSEKEDIIKKMPYNNQYDTENLDKVIKIELKREQ